MTSLTHRLHISAQAFFRTWGNPEQSYAANEQEIRQQRYAYLWDLYQGTAFEDIESWSKYRQSFSLYRQIRTVWSHVHNLVDFYATHLYHGSLAPDGLNLPDGVLNAIPLAKDTNPKLAAAIGQLWTWWNFQEVIIALVRYTAALGEVLVEIKDDPSRGKVMISLVWPAYVKDIRLDEAGNIIYYCIEYQAWDPESEEFFTFKREVDKESFRTYRNGEPFNFSADTIDYSTGGGVIGTDLPPSVTTSNGAVTPNPYGFVPACWFRHFAVMGSRGEPAVWATQAEFDEVNALFAHIIDKAHVNLNAPIIVSGNIAPSNLRQALANMLGVKRPLTDELETPTADRETLNILQGPAGTQVSTIELRISEAVEALDRIIAGIERKAPETTMYDRLRTMTQVSGPAVSRLMGDVEHKVRAIAGGYDQQLTKLLQMSVAIAGERANEGAEEWAKKTKAQQKFDGFDLGSYADGDLDFIIMPRELLPLTTLERIEIITKKKAVLPEIPQVVLAAELGYHEDEFEQWEEEYEKKLLEQQEQEIEMAKELQPAKPVGAPPGGPGGNSPTRTRRMQTRSDAPSKAPR